MPAPSVAGDPPATEGAGIYTVLNQSDGPTSIDGRGLVWTSVYEYEAASQAALVTIGDARVEADRRGSRLLEVTTGPMPCLGHADVLMLRDDVLGDLRVQGRSWSFDLTGSDVRHTWEVVR